MTEQELFKKMSDELGDYEQLFLEDGESSTAALTSAHDKIKEKYGEADYGEFEDWLNFNCAGPEG